jgi:hypothetical protein
MVHHASLPVPDLVDEEHLRIFFAPRDGSGRARVGLLEVDPADPAAVTRLHDRPVLDLGQPGAFDDDGVMPSSIVHDGGLTYLYYIGWSQSVTVPYRLAIGLAVSEDGINFTRAFDGPVVDRTRDEPFFTTAPCVLREAGGWRMWYVSTTRWLDIDGRPEPVYVIKYAESVDGVEWRRLNAPCIDQRSAEEAQGRPWVVRDGDVYRMWYCYRGSRGYRHDRSQSYRIGYAESADGVSWVRRDDDAGISASEQGWDSEMVAYPSVFALRGRWHLLYNGNGFGATGIGHATATD